MAVMEVSLPSGFTVDRDSLPSLEISSHVKRVETRNGDTMVILYFDKVGILTYMHVAIRDRLRSITIDYDRCIIIIHYRRRW